MTTDLLKDAIKEIFMRGAPNEATLAQAILQHWPESQAAPQETLEKCRGCDLPVIMGSCFKPNCPQAATLPDAAAKPKNPCAHNKAEFDGWWGTGSGRDRRVTVNLLRQAICPDCKESVKLTALPVSEKAGR